VEQIRRAHREIERHQEYGKDQAQEGKDKTGNRNAFTSLMLRVLFDLSQSDCRANCAGDIERQAVAA
jgi:hypothetical protein